MSDRGLIAVFGAGGGVGLECIKCLLAKGEKARAVVRSPDKYKDAFPKNAGLEIVQGDVTQPDSLRSALRGASGAVFAAQGRGYWSAGAVDRQGVANVAAAAKDAGVQQVVLVSSALVTPKNRWNPLRILLNNFRWRLMDEKFAGENLLRESGVTYTVVRPGGLLSKPGGQAGLAAEQGDKGSAGRISRADVGAACVEALHNPAARDVTLELKEEAGKPAGSDNLRHLFDGLQPHAQDH